MALTKEQMEARIAELEAKLQAVNKAKTRIEHANGYIKVYGLVGKGRFDISFTLDGFEQLMGMADEIRTYAKTNQAAIELSKQAYFAKKQQAVG